MAVASQTTNISMPLTSYINITQYLNKYVFREQMNCTSEAVKRHTYKVWTASQRQSEAKHAQVHTQFYHPMKIKIFAWALGCQQNEMKHDMQIL